MSPNIPERPIRLDFGRAIHIRQRILNLNIENGSFEVWDLNNSTFVNSDTEKYFSIGKNFPT